MALLRPHRIIPLSYQISPLLYPITTSSFLLTSSCTKFESTNTPPIKTRSTTFQAPGPLGKSLSQGRNDTSRTRFIHHCRHHYSTSSSQEQEPNPNPPIIKPYAYSDIKSISKQLPTNILLIDVREPHEYNSGHIPGALNLPIVSRPDAFGLSKDEFEDLFGFRLPPKSTGRDNGSDGDVKEVIFYCKAGIRSAAAARLCKEAGWENVGEYPGSWDDWSKNEEVEKEKEKRR